MQANVADERPHEDAAASDYERVCWRLAGFDGRISPEWVDGYLTGVLAGPRAIPLEQWLPAMLGGDFGRVFADPVDARQAQRALSSRWRELAQQLDAEVLVDDPDSVSLTPWLVDYEDADHRAYVEQGLGNAQQAADELRPGCASTRRVVGRGAWSTQYRRSCCAARQAASISSSRRRSVSASRCSGAPGACSA